MSQTTSGGPHPPALCVTAPPGIWTLDCYEAGSSLTDSRILMWVFLLAFIWYHSVVLGGSITKWNKLHKFIGVDWVVSCRIARSGFQMNTILSKVQRQIQVVADRLFRWNTFSPALATTSSHLPMQYPKQNVGISLNQLINNIWYMGVPKSRVSCFGFWFFFDVIIYE